MIHPIFKGRQAFSLSIVFGFSLGVVVTYKPLNTLSIIDLQHLMT